MKHNYIILLTAILILLGCSKENENIFTRGTSMVEYQCLAPFSDKVLPIYYHIPPNGDIKKMPIQFVMHGVGRNADSYRDSWIEKADEYGFIVIVPKFSKKDFPESDYQQGRIKGENGNFNEKDSLTYVLIDQIFDYFVKHSGSKAKTFNIYGHSAGAQFVHRYLMFNDTPRIGKAISANAGWYTFPTDTIDFPYGLGNSMKQLNLEKKEYYAKHLTILLGDGDTIRTSDLRVTAEADFQGLNRLSRGQYFFNYCREDAKQMEVPFNWRLKFVPGSHHSNSKMAPFAADILYGKDNSSFSEVGKISKTDYSPDNVYYNTKIPIYYYIPENSSKKNMAVLMIFHGGGRDPEVAINYWVEVAKQKGIMLIAPGFSKEEFSNLQFLYGGILDEQRHFRSIDDTMYEIFDNLFLIAKQQVGFKTSKFDIFGHSAGGQTAHRYILMCNSPYVDRVVAANSGWYTFPDNEIDYPYGIMDCQDLYDISLEHYLSQQMTIIVGDADTVVNFGLRMTPEAVNQGSNRFERGNSFYNYGKNLSQKLNCPFNWSISVVEGVGHDEQECAKRGAEILYQVSTLQ